jgi:hypothetical protein
MHNGGFIAVFMMFSCSAVFCSYRGDLQLFLEAMKPVGRQAVDERNNSSKKTVSPA